MKSKHRYPHAPSLLYRDEMARILESCDIRLSPEQLESLWTYHQLLREHNVELNLTRIHNFANMVIKLYADSILPGLLMELPSPLLDLGTGPGMPGIPLKIAFPHLHVLLAESRQNRVGFLNTVCERLALEDMEIIGRGINEDFEQPVEGVITRAVESIPVTLGRVEGCLSKSGLAVFMKGPHCDEEIREALRLFAGRYRLHVDRSYNIPQTPHERRLVVFQREDEPSRLRKAEAVKQDSYRKIESEQNDLFKDLKKLLSSRGIKKQGRAILSGSRQVTDALRDFPHRCLAWVGMEGLPPPPEQAHESLSWYELSPPLFRLLDIFGTHAPLLVIEAPPIPSWEPSQGFPEGCSLLVPFQDPENVGAVIRSAVAFGASRIILLAESAHPFHPKALRSSGGVVMHAEMVQGPSLEDLPDDLAVVPLSPGGGDITVFDFPGNFGLLPGLEGPGLPQRWKSRSVSIPMTPRVESLNASAATAVALFAWSLYRRRRPAAGP